MTVNDVLDEGAPSDDDLAALVQRLDLEAKVRLLTGETFWRTYALPEIGLRQVVLSDGPAGVRGETWDERDLAATVPSPTALAASWDDELVQRVGALLAGECRRKGVDVLLAPTVNLHRSPLGGRHFECFSEDPLLSAGIGTAYVLGLQRAGVGACVKHFVGNDSETDRMTVDVRVPAQALHELYLAPFEQIIHAAQPWSIMAAYNSVDGTTMTEHELLDLPRESWGYDGVVMSDWTATRSTEPAARAALDLAMPGPDGPWGERLVAAVRDGRVPAAAVDAKVHRLLRLAARVGALDGVPPAATPPQHEPPGPGSPPVRELLREAAAAGTVLLRNDGELLPLQVGTLRRLAVIGPNAAVARAQGGGSATVYPPHTVSPLAGLRGALGEQVQVTHTAGVHTRDGIVAARPEQVHDPVNGEPGVRVRYLDPDGRVIDEEHRLSGRIGWSEPGLGHRASAVELEAVLPADVTGAWSLGVAGCGRLRLDVDGERLLDEQLDPPEEGFAAFLTPSQRWVTAELAEDQRVTLLLRYEPQPVMGIVAVELGLAAPRLTPEQELERAVQHAADADVAVVVVGTTDLIESEGYDRSTLALPGAQDELVRRVAAANPRTVVVVNSGAPVLMPWREQVPAVLLSWFGGQQSGDALADVLLGTREPGGRMPTSWPQREQDCPVLSTTPLDGALDYSEGIRIGYRGWAAQLADGGAPPAYWFGHGLGYTSWQLDGLVVPDRTAPGRRVPVRVRLRNTGERSGRQLVQVYVAGPGRPEDRSLAGYAWVSAAAGEATETEITLAPRAFERWDGGWSPVPGEFAVSVGPSAGEQVLTAALVLQS